MNAGLQTLEPQERRTILEAAWFLAAVDGTLASGEKKVLRELGAGAELPEAELADIERMARAKQLKPRLPAGPEARRALLDVVTRLSAADGEVSDKERAVLSRIAKLLDLSFGDLEDKVVTAQGGRDAPTCGPALGLDFRKPIGDSLRELKGDLAEEFCHLRALLRGRSRRLDFPLLVLLAGEATVFLGILFLGWSIYQAVLLFWWETVVIGFYNMLKMMAADDRVPAGPKNPPAIFLKLLLIPFFMVHFGGFCFGHGIFLSLMFNRGFMQRAVEFQTGPFSVLFGGIGEVLSLGLIASAALLFTGHGISFVKDYLGRGEYRRVPSPVLMLRPYGRIIVTHLAIFAFALPCLFLPRLAAALVVPLKMAFDMASNRKERRRYEEMDEDLAPPGPEASWAARHRAGLQRMLSTATAIVVLAVIIGGVVWAVNAPSRAREARGRAMFAPITTGMTPRQALTALSWSEAYSGDGKFELRRLPREGIRIQRTGGSADRLEREAALKFLDERLPDLVRSQPLHLVVADGEERFYASVRFAPDGRVISVGAR